MKIQNTHCVKRIVMMMTSVSCILLFIVGCEGGIIGTSSGPGPKEYELKNLPERVSPDLPENILRNESNQLEKQRNKMIEAVPSEKNSDGTSDESFGWGQVSSSLNTVALRKLVVEEATTFVDLAFSDIQNQCEQQPVDCTIPAGTLEVTMTQDVVERMIRLYTEWDDSISKNFTFNFAGVGWFLAIDYTDFPENNQPDENEILTSINTTQAIKDRFNSLLNSKVEFGSTTYSRLNGAPYDHVVSTSIKYGSEERFNEIHISWREDESVVKYHANTDYEKYFIFGWEETVLPSYVEIEAVSISDNENYASVDYFYEKNAPGEMVVSRDIRDFGLVNPYQAHAYIRVIGTDADNSGILVDTEFAVSGTLPDEPPPPAPSSLIRKDNANPERLTRISIQSQLDNNGGYFLYSEPTVDAVDKSILKEIILYKEAFNGNGALLAGEHCFLNFNNTVATKSECSEDDFQSYGPIGGSVIDSAYYFEPNEYDLLISMQDTPTWQIQGLPEAVDVFAVVSADQTTALAERETLCSGFQGVSEDDVQVYCIATDEELQSTVVVELEQGIPERIITEASLVQKP